MRAPHSKAPAAGPTGPPCFYQGSKSETQKWYKAARLEPGVFVKPQAHLPPDVDSLGPLE